MGNIKAYNIIYAILLNLNKQSIFISVCTLSLEIGRHATISLGPLVSNLFVWAEKIAQYEAKTMYNDIVVEATAFMSANGHIRLINVDIMLYLP